MSRLIDQNERDDDSDDAIDGGVDVDTGRDDDFDDVAKALGEDADDVTDAAPRDEDGEQEDEELARALDDDTGTNDAGDDDDEDEDDEDDDEDDDQPRDAATGRFTRADAAKDPAQSAGGQPAADGTAPAAAAAAASAAPTWEPVSVAVNKEQVPIEEARVTKVNGHYMLAIPEDKYQRFQLRLSRGVLGERLYRDLETGRKQLDEERRAFVAEKEGPQLKSDAEIEADLYVAALKEKGILESVFEPHELKILDLEIQAAQRTARDAHQTARSEYLAKLAEPTPEEAASAEEDEQATGLATYMKDLVAQFPNELAGLEPNEMTAVFHDLWKVRRGVFWKEGNDWYANGDAIYDAIRARRASKGTVTTPPATRDAATAPGAGNGTVPTGDAAAERFNRGQDTAATPSTTNVKANRGKASHDRTPSRATRDERRRSRAPERTERDEQMEAEDEFRKATKDFMRSPGLDFP